MRAYAQVNVGRPQPDQLRRAESRLDREREQGVIASASPRGPVRSRKEGLDFRLCEEGDQTSFETFRGDRQ